MSTLSPNNPATVRVLVSKRGTQGPVGDVTPEATAAMQAAQAASEIALVASTEAINASVSANTYAQEAIVNADRAETAASLADMAANESAVDAANAAASAAEAAEYGFPDAPDDGAAYVRINSTWRQLYAPLAVAGELMDGVVSEPYTGSLSVTGGLAPYALGGYVLPPGLTAALDVATISVTGTPTAEWSGEASINVGDSFGSVTSAGVSIEVANPPLPVLDGLAVWYDGRRSAGTVYQDSNASVPAGPGDRVHRINDSSGNGRHAVMPTEAARPVYRLDSDGFAYLGLDAGQLMRASGFVLAQPNTIIVAGFANNTTSLLTGATTTGRHDITASQSNNRLNIFAGVSLNGPDFRFMLGVKVFLCGVFDGANSQFYQDGEQVAAGNAGLMPMDGITVGGQADNSLRTDGGIYQVLVYNRRLSSAEIAQVRGWVHATSMPANAAGDPDGLILASAVVAPYGGGVLRHREPSVCVLSDSPAETTALVTWMEKGAVNVTGHSEMPCRIAARKYTFNKATKALLPVGPATVVAQQDGFLSGRGHQQGPHTIKIPAGPHAGRVLMVYSQNDNPNIPFSQVNDTRNIYLKFSDDDAVTWSEPRKIVDAPSFGQPYCVVPGNGSFVQIPEGPHAGRLVFPMYANRTYLVYSDDGGDTFTLSAPSASVVGATEPNVAVRPDGSLLVTVRIDNRLDQRWHHTSVDGGATMQSQGPLPGYPGTDCNAGIVQTDVIGGGRVVLGGPEGYTGGMHAGQRHNYCLRAALGNSSEFGDRYRLFDESRYVGYSSLASFDGGLFVTYETGLRPINVDESVELVVVDY